MFFSYKTVEYKCNILFICIFKCKFLNISKKNNLKNYQIVAKRDLDFIFLYSPRMFKKRTVFGLYIKNGNYFVIVLLKKEEKNEREI